MVPGNDSRGNGGSVFRDNDICWLIERLWLPPAVTLALGVGWVDPGTGAHQAGAGVSVGGGRGGLRGKILDKDRTLLLNLLKRDLETRRTVWRQSPDHGHYTAQQERCSGNAHNNEPEKKAKGTCTAITALYIFTSTQEQYSSARRLGSATI